MCTAYRILRWNTHDEVSYGRLYANVCKTKVLSVSVCNLYDNMLNTRIEDYTFT